jgi:site-specific DNA-methyltransferase (adenine-specific)
MGKKWDNTGNFYKWCFDRAELLFGVIKNGGYVAVFGHPKTNHRMKCAFEDAGFKIVEEIDWVYLTGMPKNQDIGKLFDKKAGAEREVIGASKWHCEGRTTAWGTNGVYNQTSENMVGDGKWDTEPSTDLAKQWDGWKTAGLKPAHEPITIFQKPLEGTYIQNIEKYGCGGMNIDACRVPYQNETDINVVKAKCNFTENAKSIGFGGKETIYGTGNTPLDQARECVKEEGRFPANIILDEYIAQELDDQTGISKSSGGSGDKSKGALGKNLYGDYKNEELATHAGGLGDVGGGSRMFTIIKYCPKVAPKERMLPNGERNPHVTLKPVELIKWLIKLLTPVNGVSIDITAGSCTHAVACQELNKNDGYNLKWIDIELTNTEEEPYCNVGKMRVEAV